MFQRSRGVLLVSPVLLGTILVALVSTAVVILTWYVDVTTPPRGSGVTSDRANLIVTVGFASVAWASVFFAICFDVLARRVDDLSDQLRQTRSELAEEFTRTAERLIARAGELGVLHGLELSQEEREHSPSGPGPQEGRLAQRGSRSDAAPQRGPFLVQ